MLRNTAYNLHLSALSGATEKSKALSEEIHNPKIGDLVIERSSAHMKGRDPLEGFGTLIAIENHPICSLEEWQDELPIPTEKVYVITLDFIDGREYRWTNASFIKAITSKISIF